MASNKRHFKMYARYDGTGKIIPGSNIWAKKAPKIGNWVEVQAYECCNFTTTTTSTTGEPPCVTYQALVSRGVALVIYTDCGGETQSVECFPGTTLFCALLGQYTVLGQAGVFFIADECLVSTTTTTTQELQPSDIRLKENITATGNKVGEFDEYTWQWNKKAKELGFDKYPTKGVLALDVAVKRPDAVVLDKGYMKVNYNLIR